MMNTNESAKRAMELVAGGKSLEEALAIVLAEVQKAASTGKVDRLALANSFTSIADVDDAIHKAHSKKSKSLGNDEKVAKYQLEIDTLKAKRVELLGKISQASDPIQTAIEVGTADKGIIQMFLKARKDELDAQILKVKEIKKLSNVKIKEELNTLPTETPEIIKTMLGKYRATLLAEYERQLASGNQWILTTNRQTTFVAKYSEALGQKDKVEKGEEAILAVVSSK